MTKAKKKSGDRDGRRTKYLDEKVTTDDQIQRRKELQRIYERASDLAMQLGFAFRCGKSNLRQLEMMRYNQHAACMPGTEKNKTMKKKPGLFAGGSHPLQGKVPEEMEAGPSEDEQYESNFPLQDDEEMGNYPSWQDRCKEMEAAKQDLMDELLLRSLSLCALD